MWLFAAPDGLRDNVVVFHQITCTKALKDWESKEGNPPLTEATVVRIYGGVPYEDGGKVKRAFITKLDNGLNGLKECVCVALPAKPMLR